jgi:putative endonuclease
VGVGRRSDGRPSDPRRWLGALGERLARDHLESRGLEIVDVNYRTRWGELDVIAADDRALVFCEVKTRATGANAEAFGPLTSVGTRKRRQVRLMARQWLSDKGPSAGRRPPRLRFDAIGVTLDGTGRLVAIEHVEDAF